MQASIYANAYTDGQVGRLTDELLNGYKDIQKKRQDGKEKKISPTLQVILGQRTPLSYYFFLSNLALNKKILHTVRKSHSSMWEPPTVNQALANHSLRTISC
jgi:hypothetical protein